MKRHITGLILAAVGILPGLAQELHESFEVVGTYKPEIIIRDRVFVLPSRTDITMESTPLPYSVKSVAATFAPDYLNLPPTGWRGTRDLFPQRGYVELDMGSWLQTNLSAGYRFINTKETKVGAMLQYNSTTLWQPYKDVENSLNPSAKRELYDGTIGVYGIHHLKGVGTLGGELYYRLGYFNYYGMNQRYNTEAQSLETPLDLPTQTLNNVTFRGQLTSETKFSGVEYAATIGVNHFGYRSLYQWEDELLTRSKGERETQLTLQGSAGYRWISGNRLAMGVRADYIGYSKMELADLREPTSYGNMSLNPNYTFENWNLLLRVGANVNFTMNARDAEGARFSTVHVAPDINVSYRSGKFGVYATGKGGVELQTLSALSELDYYQQPYLPATTPITTPIDARVGVNVGPFQGLRLGLNVGYKITDNVLQRGLYSSYLNLPYTIEPLTGITEGAVNIKGLQLGLDADYEFGTLLAARMHATYSPQTEGNGYFNGYDRPRWILDAGLELSPIKRLHVNLDYEYRGVRKMNLPDMTLLNLGASYGITEAITVKASVNNLLNSHGDLLPDLPHTGMNFLVGAAIKF